MRIVLTESQLDLLLTEDRVDFLKGQHVVDKEKVKQMLQPDDEEHDPEADPRRKRIEVSPIQNEDGVDIAYIITKKGKKQVKLTEEIFEAIKEADPTRNKEYMQWMIEVFARHIKEDDVAEAVRFVTEDLPEANEFLTLFDSVKNTRLFRLGAPKRPNAPKNPKDIRQYKDLGHLYSVVSPFMGMSDEDDDGEEGVSRLYKNIKKFVDLGQAEIAYHDNDVLVYVPKHIDASCEPLGPLASWCTRRSGNSYFDSYRKNNPLPDGSPSLLYVIMPKELFDMENPAEHNSYPYQFHFETNQIHDKSNRGIGDSGLQELINRFPGLAEFFRKEMGDLGAGAVSQGVGLIDNRYIEYLNKFGGSVQDYVSDEVYAEGVESLKNLAKEETGPINKNKYIKWLVANTDDTNLLNYLNPEAEQLDFSDLNNLGELPDLSSFTNLTSLSAGKCNLRSMPPAEYLPSSLVILTLNDNQIPEAPLAGYEKFENLFVLNVNNNPVRRVNTEVLQKLLFDHELVRFMISNPDDLENAAEYKSVIDQMDDTQFWKSS
jgi:hypothetical protein